MADPLESAFQNVLLQLLLVLLRNSPLGTMPAGFPGIAGLGEAAAPAPGFGGSAGSAAASPEAPASPAVGGASGASAVDQGRQFLGQNAIDLKGRLPRFTAAGGQTNNCADFVSSLLENAGQLQGHYVNVKQLEQALKRQGWRQIPAAQAMPGDVWMNHSRGHVELVTAPGGTRTIGSNNDRPGHQVISERAKSPSSGVYYTRR